MHVIPRPKEHFSVKILFLPLFLCASFCPTVATGFYSSWDECPTNLLTLPVFPELPNMAHDDLVQPVAATAITQVILCPYNEEKPHIWFRLIEAQFAVSNPQNSNKPMLSPTCPNKSFGIF